LRWAGAAIDDLVAYSSARAPRAIDPRIARAIETLATHDDPEKDDAGKPHPSVAAAARTAGLSTSRFQHLFKDGVGVSYRRYRVWARMRAALRDVVAGSNFTTAAHAAGFCDQAHFSHAFRRTFGAPASKSLARIRR
jgi:AraC-like DNA-binding protein